MSLLRLGYKKTVASRIGALSLGHSLLTLGSERTWLPCHESVFGRQKSETTCEEVQATCEEVNVVTNWGIPTTSSEHQSGPSLSQELKELN